MRKILFFSMLALAILLTVGCQQRKTVPEGSCHIVGTISEQYNGKRIFLVPLVGPKTAEYVDSIEVSNGHFEFTKDTLMMAKVLMDYHYRFGLQPLLVVVEPGEVQVVIDSISHAVGTPQNDSLEKWKQVTEVHNMQLASLRRAGRQAEGDSVHLAYKKFTRSLASNMKEGLLHEFLKQLYPLTYKKKMPDGRIVTMNADTNEEIAD